MINVRLSQIYNNKPYYEIRKGRKVCYALGSYQAIDIIKSLREKREQIKVKGIDKILNEHNKLIEFIKNDKENN